jgi:hypothetical protein
MPEFWNLTAPKTCVLVVFGIERSVTQHHPALAKPAYIINPQIFTFENGKNL